MKSKRTSRCDKWLDDEEPWIKQLGADPKYVRCASNKEEKELDDSLGLEALTVRLDKKLLRRLRAAAKREGLGHVAYIRQILTDHMSAAPAVPKRRST